MNSDGCLAALPLCMAGIVVVAVDIVFVATGSYSSSTPDKYRSYNMRVYVYGCFLVQIVRNVAVGTASYVYK